MFAAIAALLVGSFAAAPADAQVSNLDDQRFIKGLRERGMKDLIVHFLDNNPIDDPLISLEIQIEMAKLTAEDEKLPPEDRATAFDRVRPLYIDLLKKAPFTHWKRPIWATDMVQWDYETFLRARHVNTADFVEFGGATGTNAKQKNLFNEIAPADTTFMDEAGLDMFAIKGEKPKMRKFQQLFVNNGNWDQITNYDELNLPFYKAMALRYGGLLDEKQKKQIAQVAGKTFDQLLGDADADLKRLGGKDELPAATRAKIWSLHGRIKVARKQADPAIALLDKAITTKDIAPFEKLVSLLAKSQALELKKDTAGALKAIEDAKKLVKDEKAGIKNPINLILVYARQRALTGKDAVWGELLNDDMIKDDPGLRAAVQSYVNELLIDPNADPEALAKDLGEDATPEKILAAADALLAQATPHLQQAKQAKAQNNTQEEAAHMKAANEFLKPAATILTKLAAREKIEPAQRAKALFKLGVIEFQRGQRVEGARAWITVAAEHSDQPEAGDAIKYGVIASLEVYNQIDKKNPTFIKLVDDALHTLMEKYPRTAQAKEHTYTLGAFLREQDRFEEAVAAFKNVPEDHPLYPDAKYELGVSLSKQMEQTVAENERAAKANEAKLALAAAERAIKAVLTGSIPTERGKSLRQKWADAVLRQAEAMIALNQNGEASNKLRDFDKQFAEFPEMVKEARKANIKVLANLNNIEQAFAEAKKLAAQFPDEGGPLFNEVLSLLNKRRDQLLLLSKDAEAQKIADQAADIARSLLAWAKTQPDLKDNLTPFELILARQLVIAGKGAEALAIFDKLQSVPGGEDNADIIFGRAEASFMVAANEPDPEKQAALEKEAMKGAAKIANRTADPKHEKAVWWRAWVIINSIEDRRFDRARAAGDEDAMTKHTGNVWVSVNKLNRSDKNFGAKFDPDIKAVLQRLLNKHRPKSAG